MQRSAIDTSRSSRSARPWAKEGRPANLQGHGLDLIQGPEEEGILGHAAEAVVGGPDQDLDPDHVQDPGPLHGQEAGLGPMVDLNLAHLLKADQSPDPPLQREVIHRQEALEEGVQVL
ncbi:unnamed protein product [Caretta caretta]